jgi:hypothetical protein
MRIFQGTVEQRKWGLFKSRRFPVRAIDVDGIIRVQRSDSVVASATAAAGDEALRQLWEETTIYNGDSVIVPDMFVIVGSHVVDLTGTASLEQALAVAQSEFEGLASDAPIALISIRGARGL